MPELNLKSINETLTGGMKPKNEDQDIGVDGLDKAGLKKLAEMTKGETLLENTLDLVELKLTMKKNQTLAKKLIEKLRRDKTALEELKTELLNNIDKFNGNDKREKIAERVATSLISELY